MEIRTKEELLAALRLAQIHVECEDVDINRAFVDKTLSCNSDIRVNGESIEYNLRFTVSRRIPVPPKRVKIRKLREI